MIFVDLPGIFQKTVGGFLDFVSRHKIAVGILNVRLVDHAVDESYVAPADFEVNGETIVKGSWVLVTKAGDEIWEQIKKGSITGYSMAGTAETVEHPPRAGSKTDETGSFFQLFKQFFAGDKQKTGEEEKKMKRSEVILVCLLLFFVRRFIPFQIVKTFEKRSQDGFNRSLNF